MAELVNKNLESMLPELEELERTGIFTHQEIRLDIPARSVSFPDYHPLWKVVQHVLVHPVTLL